MGRFTKSYKNMKNNGFTLIEVIVAMTLIAIVMIPAALISMSAVKAAADGDAWTMASNLARRELGVVSMLPYADLTLATGYNVLTSSYQGYRYDLRRQVTAVTGTTDLRRVAVTVYPAGSLAQILRVDTYVINNFSTGYSTLRATVSPEGGALTVTGAFAGNNNTITINPMKNNSALGNIAVTGLYVWSTQTNRTLRSVTMDGVTVWTGNLTISASQPAQPNISLTNPNPIVSTASCVIGPLVSITTGTTFVFSGNVTGVVSIKYRMSDGTDSATFTFT